MRLWLNFPRVASGSTPRECSRYCTLTFYDARPNQLTKCNGFSKSNTIPPNYKQIVAEIIIPGFLHQHLSDKNPIWKLCMMAWVIRVHTYSKSRLSVDFESPPVKDSTRGCWKNRVLSKNNPTLRISKWNERPMMKKLFFSKLAQRTPSLS